MDLEARDDDHIRLKRSSLEWAEKLKIEAKKVKDLLNKMKVKQQQSDNQRLAGIKPKVFDKGI